MGHAQGGRTWHLRDPQQVRMHRNPHPPIQHLNPLGHEGHQGHHPRGQSLTQHWRALLVAQGECGNLQNTKIILKLLF